MPYISQERRISLEVSVGNQPTDPPHSAGELCYLFSQQIQRYLDFHPNRFDTFAEIMGALVLTGLEFYRRIVVPYENKKLKENGDVYKKRDP